MARSASARHVPNTGTKPCVSASVRAHRLTACARGRTLRHGQERRKRGDRARDANAATSPHHRHRRARLPASVGRTGADLRVVCLCHATRHHRVSWLRPVADAHSSVPGPRSRS
ncbi:hypothetical protein GUJ93_ZPchr0001g29963 [Zizania palustris]|uniref:Uncharacterized protein n=1 Tax=Zizania palustris TaxID=103762 RepID=A0A8J5S450_ZIZPA|nr:hypothetical protein GUJ93_ZPchr0001g29963 [Zizania palustris]